MTTRIGQVRIRANTDDALAARMRGEATLRALDLEPAAMPARMILCIRAMPDPLPGGVDLRSAHAQRPIEWERAARNAVGDAFRRAARPLDGTPSTSSDAVLFDDRAELLACAACDAVDGRPAWWWRYLLRGTTLDAVIAEWRRHPTHIAAAMELLARRSAIAAFVRHIPPRDASELLSQVLETHGLPSIAAEISRTPGTPATTASAMTRFTLPPSLVVPDLARPDVTNEQRLFATVTLAVRRAPALLRSIESARTLIAMVASMTATALPPRAPAIGQPGTPGNQERPEPEPTAITRPRNESKIIAPRKTRTTASATHDSPPDRAMGRAPETVNLTEEPARRRTSPPSRIDAASLSSHGEFTEDVREPKAAAAVSCSEAIATRYGGLFFLLNVAVDLGFYDPYGREASIDLDVWDFLSQTGRAIDPQVADDALWPLLAKLANRSDETLLAPVDDDLFARVCGALAMAGFADEDASKPSASSTEASDGEEHAAACVIRQPAHVTVTPAHVDVTFCLASHPIEIRAAGLDRDPGWIPAAGRHVDFHFE